ncbi:MAG: hypothetical protein ACXIVE_01260, partial [Salinarimonas sp.]
MVFDLRTDRGRADASEDTNRDSQSSITSTLVDAAVGAIAGITENQISDRSEPQPLRRGLNTSALALLEIVKDNKMTKVIVPDPAPPAPEPIVDLVETKKVTGASGTKPATPGTGIDHAAPFPGLLDDANREARENRVYDLLFGESRLTRFGASIGDGPLTSQEMTALRFFRARYGHVLAELRDRHDEDALRVAVGEIMNILEENAGQVLPPQQFIDAQFNAALELALHPDSLYRSRASATRLGLFAQIIAAINDRFLIESSSTTPEIRSALNHFIVYQIELLTEVASDVPYADRPALMEAIAEVVAEQGHGPVDQRAFTENLKAAISLFLAQRAASQTPIIPALQQDAQELFRQANEQARRILEEANQPFADRTATIREAIEQAAANGDVYLQMALMDLLPPELGDALVPSSVVDPATSTALLNHLRNMRAPEAEAVLEELEANPGNVAPEILDALREAVDPRSALSSETKLKYDNYIANGTFSEEQYRKLKRLNPDRSPEEIINFLALLSQGIPLPGYVTREPEPAPPPGETTFGPVGRASQEEL